MAEASNPSLTVVIAGPSVTSFRGAKPAAGGATRNLLFRCSQCPAAVGGGSFSINREIP